LLVCVDVDIMKTPNMASNLDATTNPGSVSNVIPKAGAPDYWTPPTTDAVPAVQVILPVVNGAVPGSYELTEINIIASNFNSFTVTVYDSGDNIAFTVSYLSYTVYPTVISYSVIRLFQPLLGSMETP